MAGRPPKKRIDYAGWSVDMFDSDTKIDNLIDGQGWVGFGIWFYLCQRAYGSDGYFFRWSYDDSATTARKMGGGVGSEAVRQTVGLCLQIGLFEKRLFDRDGILTSRGIQKRYYAVIADRLVKAVIGEYWLLSPEESPGVVYCPINSNLSPTNANLSPINTDYVPTKKSKVKKSKASSSTQVEGTEDDDEEVETPFGSVTIDQGWQHICNYYMDNLGNLPMGIALDELQALYDQMGEQLVKKAIEEASRSQPRYPLRYLCSLLKKWHDDGLHTLHQVNADSKTFQMLKQPFRQVEDDDPYKGYTRLED